MSCGGKMKPASARRMLTRRWARRGTRPRAPRDQRRPNGPISSARSVPRRSERRRAGCPGATPTPGGAPIIEIDVPPSIPAPMRSADGRSGLGSHLTPAGDPRQHHRPGAAARSPRVEPGGECLAIPRDNIVEPDLQILRRHRRAVLPASELPHRPTMEDHVLRHVAHGRMVSRPIGFVHLDRAAQDRRAPRCFVALAATYAKRSSVGGACNCPPGQPWAGLSGFWRTFRRFWLWLDGSCRRSSPGATWCRAGPVRRQSGARNRTPGPLHRTVDWRRRPGWSRLRNVGSNFLEQQLGPGSARYHASNSVRVRGFDPAFMDGRCRVRSRLGSTRAKWIPVGFKETSPPNWRRSRRGSRPGSR